jgi:hypothetical protein
MIRVHSRDCARTLPLNPVLRLNQRSTLDRNRMKDAAWRRRKTAGRRLLLLVDSRSLPRHSPLRGFALSPTPGTQGVGLGSGVGRSLGDGLDLGVGLGRTVAVGVAVGVTVGVAVGVTLGVTVGVVVGVGVTEGVTDGVGVGVGTCPPGNTRT